MIPPLFRAPLASLHPHESTVVGLVAVKGRIVNSFGARSRPHVHSGLVGTLVLAFANTFIQ